MAESLRQKQSRFVRLVVQLINFAHERGYELTFGHATRCGTCLVGRHDSLHKEKLAIDLHLFKDGKYLSSTEAHQELGEYWESLAPDCSWGGRFNDGNHYSLKHNGRR